MTAALYVVGILVFVFQEAPGEPPGEPPAVSHPVSHPVSRPGPQQAQRSANCARVGTNGSTRNRIPASAGVRSALRWLHGEHAATVFCHDHAPPRLAGSTWSTVVARSPQ